MRQECTELLLNQKNFIDELQIEKMDLILQNLELKKSLSATKFFTESRKNTTESIGRKQTNRNDTYLDKLKSQQTHYFDTITNCRHTKSTQKSDSNNHFATLQNPKISKEISNPNSGFPLDNNYIKNKNVHNYFEFPKEYKDDASIVSISTVPKEYNEISASDIEIIDNCVMELNRNLISPTNNLKMQLGSYKRLSARTKRKYIIKHNRNRMTEPDTNKNISKKPQVKFNRDKESLKRFINVKCDGYFSEATKNCIAGINSIVFSKMNTPKKSTINIEIPRSKSVSSHDTKKNRAKFCNEANLKSQTNCNKNITEGKTSLLGKRLRDAPCAKKFQINQISKPSGNLTNEIEELIKKQKENLRMDFEKAKEAGNYQNLSLNNNGTYTNQ